LEKSCAFVKINHAGYGKPSNPVSSFLGFYFWRIS